MSDIVERLAHANEYEPLGYVGWEAADEILRLREENARLREALKPFSAFADAWEKQPLYGMDNTIYALHGGEHCGGVELKLTDLRAAAAALQEGEKDGNNN